jgi:hypothetical protein
METKKERKELTPLFGCKNRPYVIRRRKIHFPHMSETAILQQEPAMTSEVKLSETETICMLDSHLPTVEEKPLSFYVIRRRKIHFPQMSETAILQQEPAMTSKVKLSETETICMLNKSATEAPPLLKLSTVNALCTND